MASSQDSVNLVIHYHTSMVCVICGNPDFDRYEWETRKTVQKHRLKTVSFSCGKMMALCPEHYSELKEKDL